MSDPVADPNAGTNAPAADSPVAADSCTPMMKEVRLGLVCSGGVSLAIYMHGVTKELYKLVRAARAFERAYQASDFDPDHWLTGKTYVQGSRNYDSERAYFCALADLAQHGTPMTVVLDTVVGNSAGAINCVGLARGLAEGRSLNSFRQLWLDEGDMQELLASQALFPWGRGRMLSKLAESVARLGWHPESELLNGDLMSRLLFSALNEMEPVEESFVPADGSLDLFVTTTQVFGYDTIIPADVANVSHVDKFYRQMLHFRYGYVPSDPYKYLLASDFRDVPALAFAARATSGFPGTVPPVSLHTFLQAINVLPALTAEESLERIPRHFVYESGYGTATTENQWFMDGNVVGNGPFAHVVETIAAKQAVGPTAREIIYLEPDPGTSCQDGSQPAFIRTLWASRVTIPDHTSLAGLLSELQIMNTAVAEVEAITRAHLPDVLSVLSNEEPVRPALSGMASYAEVVASSEYVRRQAYEASGFLGYASYSRLRVQAMAESIAASLAAQLRFPADSNRSNFIVSAFRSWAARQPGIRQSDPEALEQQVGTVDVPFRIRRAEFVLLGINELFDGANPAMSTQLAAMKSACWDLLATLRGQQRKAASMLIDQAAALFGAHALSQHEYLANPDTYAATGADSQGSDLARLYDAYLQVLSQAGIVGSSQNLWYSLIEHSNDWDQATRAALLSRYIGFPIWDSLILTVVSTAKLPQLAPITVRRFSPLDATCLQAVDDSGVLKPDPSAKLNAVTIRHFGAFFDKSWRENDYLWGRLDGAELVMRLLSRHSDGGLDFTEPLRSALASILETEQADLSQIGPVCNALAHQVRNIRTMGPNGVA
jgi:patatin-related protein